MKTNWVQDISDMHQKFGVNDWVKQQIAEGNHEVLRKFLGFRINFLAEELGETTDAYVNADAEEVIDGLIDLCVIAIGTLDILGVDADDAWDQVHNANMAKEPGVKPSRPNPFGLPDLIKPEGWTGPDHGDNHGDAAFFVHGKEHPKW